MSSQLVAAISQGGCEDPGLQRQQGTQGGAGQFPRDLGSKTNRAEDRLEIKPEGEEGVSGGSQVTGLSVQVGGDVL